MLYRNMSVSLGISIQQGDRDEKWSSEYGDEPYEFGNISLVDGDLPLMSPMQTRPAVCSCRARFHGEIHEDFTLDGFPTLSGQRSFDG
jgi:hypothetical protein